MTSMKEGWERMMDMIQNALVAETVILTMNAYTNAPAESWLTVLADVTGVADSDIVLGGWGEPLTPVGTEAWVTDALPVMWINGSGSPETINGYYIRNGEGKLLAIYPLPAPILVPAGQGTPVLLGFGVDECP